MLNNMNYNSIILLKGGNCNFLLNSSWITLIPKETDMGLKNFKVRAEVKDDKGNVLTENPYRRGTSKRAIMAWAMERGEFTKAEFTVAIEELLAAGEVESKMSPDICARAWWNEFYSKFRVFLPID